VQYRCLEKVKKDVEVVMKNATGIIIIRKDNKSFQFIQNPNPRLGVLAIIGPADRFEKALYKDPDADLNELWWDLVEKYQKVRRIDGRDKPDWATKIHICSYPVYYHNYMLGELLASQFLFTIMKEEGVDKIKDLRFAGNIKMGKYFVNRVFRPGKKYRWDRLVEYATGESLNPEYFVKQFCR